MLGVSTMKIILFAFFMAISSPCIADDMQQYLTDTQDLVSMEEYEEALERTIWFHNNALKHERSMYGVRLSYALMYWKDLGDKYPPALKALKDLRDKNTKEILADSDDKEIFHDVIAINSTLEESDKTIALFKQLDANRPQYAKSVWHFVKDEVVEHQDYELIKKYMGDIFIEYTRTEIRFVQMMSYYSDNKTEFGEDFYDTAIEMYAQETNRLLNVAASLNEFEILNKIKYRVSLIENDYALNDILNN